MRFWPCVALALTALFLWAVPAMAQTEPAGLAASLPLEITEVVTGGSWVDGPASGSYRTITVQSAATAETSEVFLQWIGSRSPVSALQILSSVPLREFNDHKLASASINLDAEIDGRIKISVTGQDNNGRPETLVFVATKPSQYEVVPPEKASATK